MAYTTIKKPSDYFNTKLYTGNGTGQSITGVGFQPDFVWTKRRNQIGVNFLQNIVQGTNKALISDQDSAEFIGGVDGGTSVTSFDSDGFTIGTEGAINGNNDTFASWNWLANGTGVSNTDGSITSTVSANTTSGFSVVSWTGNATSGATVGHGLGSVPKMIIVKNRTDAINWIVYHNAIGNTGAVFLDVTNGTDVGSFYWNNTSPTSSVFSLGNYNGSNGSSDDMIAYCFSEVKGFSKFGSYTGNGSTNGPFIYLGFKPAFFLLKETSGADNWTLMDSKRLGYNPRNEHLFPNLSNAEYATDRIDMVSNGIKINNDDGSINQSGSTYIYMAFAEEPLVGDNPATAR